MTSPVDTSVKFFSSAMSGAPVLSGTAGALIGVLDACLKDGFDVKTAASVVVAAGVCTVSWVGTHSALPDCVIVVAGVTDKGALNGEQKVVTKSATSLTFATTASDGVASGTITFKIAPIGWTKPFAGTSLAAYQSSDPASTKCLLKVDDSGTTTCRVVGYESMSDINTGVGPFPTAAQQSGGGYWAKSMVASSAAVQWLLIGDARAFYLCVQPGTASSSLNQMGVVRMFGDFTPYKPGGDAYAATLSYSNNSSVGIEFDGSVHAAADFKFAMPRDYTGLGTGVVAAVFPFGVTSIVNSGITAHAGAFPSAVDGSLWLCQKFLALSGSSPRGLVPGVWHGLQSGLWNTFKQGDRTPGTGTLVGRNLIAVTGNDSSTNFGTNSSASNTGILFFDVTGPWR